VSGNVISLAAVLVSLRNAPPDNAKTVARETTKYVKGNHFSTKKYERGIFLLSKSGTPKPSLLCRRSSGFITRSLPTLKRIACNLVPRALYPGSKTGLQSRGKRLVDEVGLRDEPIERLYVKGKGLDRGTVPPRLPV